MKTKSFFKTSVGIFLLGALIGVLAPSPIGPIYFYLENYVAPHLTGLSKILLQAFNWYLLDALWYFALMIVAFIMHIKKVKTIRIIQTVAGIIGLGAVIGVLFKVLMP